MLVALTALAQRAGAHVWTLAGTFGAALGPALGGALTQAFDWRAIFVVPGSDRRCRAARGLRRRTSESPTARPVRAGRSGGTFRCQRRARARLRRARRGALPRGALVRHRLGVLAARRGRDRLDPPRRRARWPTRSSTALPSLAGAVGGALLARARARRARPAAVEQRRLRRPVARALRLRARAAVHRSRGRP